MGSINAQDALSTAGNIKLKGVIPATTAAAASIGSSKLALAVLLVTSVKNVTNTHTNSTMSIGGNDVAMDSCSATSWLKPVSLKAVAIDRPPANNSMTPHGTSRVACHESKRSPPM